MPNLSDYSDTQLRELCMSLVRCDNEDDVIKILKGIGCWQNSNYWRDFGDNENNFSVIGAQQADPIAALSEKLVNSIDALLMGECLVSGISVDSSEAPASVRYAVAKYIEKSANPQNDTTGRIEFWPADMRRNVAQKISLAATGSRISPCLTVVDEGEGQVPDEVPNTFMSINRSNKLRVPFVQGKYNMGGTGVFRFCGEHSIQLLLTRRNPSLVSGTCSDDLKWSFTLVRREIPRGGERNSVFRYLAPIFSSDRSYGAVLRFSSDSMAVRPLNDIPYENTLMYGSLLKLYNYKFKNRSHVLLQRGLARVLDVKLPNPALPYIIHECRNFKGEAERSFHNPNTGLLVRLDDDKGRNVESGFPTKSRLSVLGQVLDITVFGFKKTRAQTYLSKSEGVVFSVNGQTHGTLPSRFFTRKSVGFDAISDSVLVFIDCTNIEGQFQEKLFMNTRESLAESEFRGVLEKELESHIRENSALRDFCNRRIEENVKDIVDDSKLLESSINRVLQKSPTLSRLFGFGKQLTNPFRTNSRKTSDKFNGKEFPTFFRHAKMKEGNIYNRSVEHGRMARLTFETDAENSYFNRAKEPGELNLHWLNGESEKRPVEGYSFNLYNGIATLSVALPAKYNVGDTIQLFVSVSDNNRIEPFSNIAVLNVVPFAKRKGGGGGRRKPPSNKPGEGRESPSGLALPITRWIKRDSWEEHDFDDNSAVKAVLHTSQNNGNNQYIFYLNEDNIHLLHEQKRGDASLIKEQYRVGLTLVALATIHDCSQDADGDEIRKRVDESTRAASIVLVPLINEFNALGKVGDIADSGED